MIKINLCTIGLEPTVFFDILEPVSTQNPGVSMKIKSKLSLIFLIIVLVPLILGMVVLYQSTKSSIQAIQEDSAQRYVDTVRDHLSAYFDKWKVTVDALNKMLEVKSKDWGKLKPILNAISTKYDEVRAFAMSNADGSYWYEPISGNYPYHSQWIHGIEF